MEGGLRDEVEVEEADQVTGVVEATVENRRFLLSMSSSCFLADELSQTGTSGMLSLPEAMRERCWRSASKTS